jgi:4-alpha-glucanotransferase
VDVWTHPEIFKLDEDKRAVAVAGVPPDYFSATGQLWGNPVYQWDKLKKRGYDWWVQRMEHMLRLFDVVRIDHFRGLIAFWEVPAGEKTAINGKWIKAPAADFFNTLFRRFPSLPVIAEDLGVITSDVKEVMRRFKLSGMKVLQFAFGEDDPLHPYLPHTYERNAVVYTGTHDNNTSRGWFEKEAKPEAKERLFRYIGREVKADDIPWELIRLAMMSVADLAIIPMQDILGLGAVARMNRPGTGNGNWEWQLVPGQLTPVLAEKLRAATEIYGRG